MSGTKVLTQTDWQFIMYNVANNTGSWRYAIIYPEIKYKKLHSCIPSRCPGYWSTMKALGAPASCLRACIYGVRCVLYGVRTKTTIEAQCTVLQRQIKYKNASFPPVLRELRAPQHLHRDRRRWLRRQPGLAPISTSTTATATTTSTTNTTAKNKTNKSNNNDIRKIS
eukprot:2907064-Rhodomonas_salina.2